MHDFNCLVCGKRIGGDMARCPYCNAEVGSKQADNGKLKSGRFIWLVVALAIFCLVVALWLPRDVAS